MNQFQTDTTPRPSNTLPGNQYGRLLYSPFRDSTDHDKQIGHENLEHAEPSYDAEDRTIIRIVGPDHTTYLADEDTADIHVMGQNPEIGEPRLEKVSKYLGPGIIAMLTVMVPVEGHLPPQDLDFDSLASGLHGHGSLHQMPNLFVAKSSDRTEKSDLQIYLNGVNRNPALRELPYTKLLEIRRQTLLIGNKEFFENDDQSPGVAILCPPKEQPGLRIGAITYNTETNQAKIEPFSDDFKTVITKIMPSIMSSEILVAGWITRGPNGLYVSGKNLFLPGNDDTPYPCIVIDTYNKTHPTDVLDERAVALRETFSADPTNVVDEISTEAAPIPIERNFGAVLAQSSLQVDRAVQAPQPQPPVQEKTAAPAHAPPRKSWKKWGKQSEIN